MLKWLNRVYVPDRYFKNGETRSYMLFTMTCLKICLSLSVISLVFLLPTYITAPPPRLITEKLNHNYFIKYDENTWEMKFPGDTSEDFLLRCSSAYLEGQSLRNIVLVLGTLINTAFLLYWVSDFNSKWKNRSSDAHQPHDFTIMVRHKCKTLPTAQELLEHFNKLFKRVL
eukprot:GHVR01108919.1.p1 GENE.GHVR01108919.1~~GHVR01108919.1.p1  ORF type:complete len:171 (+),score=7.88 GHVR01108919.1:381-893(+)